jgi:ABC-2 type transport system ATP-binding protein
LDAAPKLEGFSCRLDDEGVLEVDVHKGQALNDVFIQLEQQRVKVVSMRTKANRLEELFIRMVEHSAPEGETKTEGRA